MTFKMDNFSLDLNWNPKEDFYKEWKEMSS
jgi:hypothetical protein